MRRVVVTGVGAVTPCGLSVEESWRAAVAAETGVRKITLFDASEFPVQIAAEVKNFSIGDILDLKEARRTSRFVQFAVKASYEAMLDAGLPSLPEHEQVRSGVIIGAGIGGVGEIEHNSVVLKEQGHRRVPPLFMPYAIANMASGVVGKRFSLKGPTLCPATACASGTHAIGEAFLMIRAGISDLIIAGGVEAGIAPLPIAAFASMKALSTRNDAPELASRPFDAQRDGFVMGEGAGVLVLEDFEHAKKRGAKIYAELSGAGWSGDAYHITAPAPEGEGAQRCMAMAISMAGIAPEQIDYINAHGTSTDLNDRYETLAISHVFKDHAKKISISSTKGVTGHCLGAAGGIEAVFTVKALHHDLVPPTANLTHPDPDCFLDYTPLKAKARTIRHALSNSFGFGGTNGSLLFSKI